MMKLRIRSSETRETLRVEVPITCSLQQLKQLLSEKLPSASSTPPDSIHLSLNRKDEIRSSSPDEETLQALGITSGDLIFFTLDHNTFSSETLVASSQKLPSKVTKDSNNPLILDPKSLSEQVYTPMESENPRNNLHSDLSLQEEDSQQPGLSSLNTQSDEFGGEMEFDAIDGDDYDSSGLEAVGKSFSAPGFLRKVFTDELGSDDHGGRNHKLLVIAVHAVLLESGFVGFDMNLKSEIKGFQFRNDWPVNALAVSLFYTLPGIIGHVLPSSDCHNGVVVLKFQNLGKFLNIYGSLNNGFAIHSVSLNEDELVPFMNVAWANCGLGEQITSKDGNSLTSPGREVYNFWRTVKDKLALPLLMDLSERTGLELPPCFMRLPTDLKLKIFESLPGVDVAKVSCVSSELRYLSSSDDLWKQKFVEQFGPPGKLDESGNWKEKFARFLEAQKRRKLASRTPFHRAFHPRRIIDPISRFPRWPGIIGGDYDLGPRINHPFGQVGYRKARYPSRSHIPRCNLGGFGCGGDV